MEGVKVWWSSNWAGRSIQEVLTTWNIWFWKNYSEYKAVFSRSRERLNLLIETIDNYRSMQGYTSWSTAMHVDFYNTISDRRRNSPSSWATARGSKRVDSAKRSFIIAVYAFWGRLCWSCWSYCDGRAVDLYLNSLSVEIAKIWQDREHNAWRVSKRKTGGMLEMVCGVVMYHPPDNTSFCGDYIQSHLLRNGLFWLQTYYSLQARVEDTIYYLEYRRLQTRWFSLGASTQHRSSFII